jgi:hypothetical protein
MSIRLFILLVDAALVFSAGWFGYQGRVALALSIFAAAIFIAGWQAMLLSAVRSGGQSLRIENGIRQPHYVQGILQCCLYVYWGLYWGGVWQYTPLIAVQLLFAYALESVLSWSKYRVWRAGFGPVPVVLSINLFLWFREEYFFLQLSLIALTYFCKEIIRWRRDGRSTHIFNPSAFSLACVSAALLAADSLSLTRGSEITESLTLPPNVFEVIFLLGVVVQLLYLTTLVTAGALLAQFLMYGLSSAIVGVPISRLPIEVSVFLGLTLLVTDPSTSPRTNVGKLLFGVTYGAGAFLLYIGLRLIHQPAFVDKILMVPVVNLMVPQFDRVGTAVNMRFERWVWLPALRHARVVWVVLYAGLFWSVVTSLKNPATNPEGDPLPSPPKSVTVSPMLEIQLNNRAYCRKTVPEPYAPFGFLSEISEYRKVREIYLFRGLQFRLKGIDR